MDLSSTLPMLLGLAVLLPLASFFVILTIGPRLGKHGSGAAWIAFGAIAGAGVLSFASMGLWLLQHFPAGEAHHEEGHSSISAPVTLVASQDGHATEAKSAQGTHAKPADDYAADSHDEHAHAGKAAYTSEYYLLGQFGKLRISIGYYIDALTICMFCMVTFIASLIHLYAMGYMHDELHDVHDHEVTMPDGHHLHRPGRFHRFFQSLSLFCFSMLGLVLAGNIAMVFCFWELVGICSYFLIGFYIERQSASTAANKAFIVNRVGDFGMIIGLMIIWAALGTFNFGDVEVKDVDGKVQKTSGIFSLMQRTESADHTAAFHVPDGAVALASGDKISAAVRALGPGASSEAVAEATSHAIGEVRKESQANGIPAPGYWLMVVAGIGIFCGCVGKSAQFPLHTWLPDAMEGPTPVSALVHSATMVAAGVYLVGRFFPFFAPEVLLTIAVIGAITGFLAATIALTAVDIKKVLAYSTISQLGMMMLALGVGGWVAGLMHLITHAFFKSLLFMCSGSVIHAVHTNDMTRMGGLLKKMPYTGYTMLIGCLAIAGGGIPFVIGLSGYYSKDAILEQAFSFAAVNQNWIGQALFYAPLGGAAITAFYMFRMWFMTFTGKPRDHQAYDHAHESPPIMYMPLVILAVMAVGVAWTIPFTSFSLGSLLESARPDGTLATYSGAITTMTWPNEHDSHATAIKVPVTLMAFGSAVCGILLAAVVYYWQKISAAEIRRQFEPAYQFLVHKWYFDELYDFLWVRPTLVLSRFIATIDRNVFDRFLHGVAAFTKELAKWWDLIADRTLVDGIVNLFAGWLHSVGLSFRTIQTGRLRQYVMYIAVGAIAIFILISFFRSTTLAN
jgi:NADH:ubiquinone oxidoreductase subunit 5 (subunit L)/multisubunit Na+/H+ antiporter MnhA subunit